jgi:hypothetical protein
VKLLANDAQNGSVDPNIIPFPANQSSPAKVHFILPAENVSSKDLFLPIPQREILYNKLATQNAGFN